MLRVAEQQEGSLAITWETRTKKGCLVCPRSKATRRQVEATAKDIAKTLGGIYDTKEVNTAVVLRLPGDTEPAKYAELSTAVQDRDDLQSNCIAAELGAGLVEFRTESDEETRYLCPAVDQEVIPEYS